MLKTKIRAPPLDGKVPENILCRIWSDDEVRVAVSVHAVACGRAARQVAYLEDEVFLRDVSAGGVVGLGDGVGDIADIGHAVDGFLFPPVVVDNYLGAFAGV